MKGWTCHHVKSQKQLAIAPLSHTHSTRHFEHGNTLSFVDSFVHHYSVEVDNDRVPIVRRLYGDLQFDLKCRAIKIEPRQYGIQAVPSQELLAARV
jgi:hypothetical protein